MSQTLLIAIGTSFQVDPNSVIRYLRAPQSELQLPQLCYHQFSFLQLVLRKIMG